MKYLAILLILHFSLNLTHAQAYQMKRYEDHNHLAIGFGSAGYYGDLQRQLIIPFPSVTVELAHRLFPQVKLRESVSFFLLGAKDSNQKKADLKERNLSFHSQNIEITLNLQFTLLPIYSYKLRPKVNPFITMGMGAVNVSPKGRLQGKNYKLRKMSTEGVQYSKVATAYMLGTGVELALAQYVTLVSEFGYRFTNTDYLDDVSTVYVGSSGPNRMKSQLADRAPELGFKPKKAGMTRGNPEINDGYALLSFKLQFMLSHVFRR